MSVGGNVWSGMNAMRIQLWFGLALAFCASACTNCPLNAFAFQEVQLQSGENRYEILLGDLEAPSTMLIGVGDCAALGVTSVNLEGTELPLDSDTCETALVPISEGNRTLALALSAPVEGPSALLAISSRDTCESGSLVLFEGIVSAP